MILVALTRLVNTLAGGKLPAEAAPYFCGANLSVSKKKAGGLHPVAVGGVLRRLVSKCLVAKVQGEATAFLLPQQFRGGIRCGCKTLVHATLANLADSSIPEEERRTLLINFENGFNLVDCSTIISEARDHFPKLSGWVEAC